MPLDLVGRQFGRWTVVGRAGWRPGRPYWTCRCACGTLADRREDTLLDGRSQSCGCLRLEQQTRHGRTRFTGTTDPTYLAWRDARSQKRGGMCRRWEHFEAFLDDMGERPSPRHALARKNPQRPYSPSNCQWSVTYTPRAI